MTNQAQTNETDVCIELMELCHIELMELCHIELMELCHSLSISLSKIGRHNTARWLVFLNPLEILLGPVVQSAVSLTSSLRVILLTVLADSIYSILIFFAEKM